MVDTDALIGYFNKLQRTVLNNADFSLGSKKILKKEKVDDLLCCILLLLPDIYKKDFKTTYDNKYSSISSFKLLYKELKHKFWLSSDYYIVNSDHVIKAIGLIKKAIASDVRMLEKDS